MQLNDGANRQIQQGPVIRADSLLLSMAFFTSYRHGDYVTILYRHTNHGHGDLVTILHCHTDHGQDDLVTSLHPHTGHGHADNEVLGSGHIRCV